MHLTLRLNDTVTVITVEDTHTMTGTADNGDRVTFTADAADIDSICMALLLDGIETYDLEIDEASIRHVDSLVSA